MDSKSLSQFFIPVSEDSEDVHHEEMAIVLHFQYGAKTFATLVDSVKEIMDFPVYTPLPHETSFMGVFNLRGTIVPILNHHKSRLTRERQRVIVFEVDKGEFVAIPAIKITKKEILKSSFCENQAFITIDSVPYEFFDMKAHLKEAV